MNSHRRANQNAVKHGLFVTLSVCPAPSAFGDLARQVLPAHRAEMAAQEVAAAEERARRCRAVVADHLAVLAQLTEASAWDAALCPEDIDAGLRDLQRLLRYQADCISQLRKSRLAILNAAEGLELGRGFRS